MGDFTTRVVRADDLLVLRFEFFNLALSAGDGTTPRRLTRPSPGDAAHIVVHFPPQHITEEAFDENDGPPAASTDRIRSFISGESRVAFRVPDDMPSVPFTIESLLDWNSFDAATLDIEDDDAEPQPPQPPAVIQTAIEMPYRLVLAPKDGQWDHRPQPGVLAGQSGHAELWHTSYTPNPSSVFSPNFRLKAIWTPDIDSGDDVNPFPMSLTPRDRVEIVHLSSDRTLLADSNFHNLDGADLLLLAELRGARSSLLLGTELRLGALGGSMNVYSRFHFPQPLPASIYTRAEGFFDIFDPDGIFFSLENWSHHASVGRDQYVKTVRRGFLYPFGHAASLVTISERKFTQAQTGRRAAYLMQRAILIVQQPERRYDDRAFPFKSVRLSDSVVHTDVEQSPIFLAKVEDVPYRFPIVALDHDDREVHFATPLVFVPADLTGDTATIQDEYDDHETVTLPSQMISFAPDPQRLLTRDRAPEPSRTTLRTVSMTFGVKPESLGSLPIPIMQSAAVAVPAAEKMLGAAAPTVTIELNKSYLVNGFTEEANNAFADIQGGMQLAMDAQKAGGVAAPNLEMTTLSLTKGAFPDVKELVGADIPMSPEEVVKKLFKGKLLGVVDLPTLINFSEDEEHLPKIAPDVSGRNVAFFWQPKLNPDLAGPDGLLRPEPEDAVPALVLKGMISPEAVEVEGSLNNVALSFLEILSVGFSALTFKMATGRDAKFGASVSSIGFDGDLSFVDKLAKELQKCGLGEDGPTVKITPEGASAGLTLSIPTIPMGPLFLMNLSLGAMLNLYFFGKPATVSFSLSSRKDPFLITYTVFGGGGHFTFTAGTDGEIAIDAALQFGGAAEIDIGVAKGEIQAMVGIALEMKDGNCKLTGFVRIYGCVEILEIITISVEFYLALSYQAPDAIGEASLTVMVSVLGLSKSVTLRVEKRFSTEESLERDSRNAIENAAVAAVSVDDWTDYCLAFAGNG